MVYEEVANSSAPKLANLPAPLTLRDLRPTQSRQRPVPRPLRDSSSFDDSSIRKLSHATAHR